MVIRSRHRDYVKRNSLSEYLIRWYVRAYPFLEQAAAKRVRRYNETVALIRRPPNGVAIVEICPPERFRVSRLSQDLSVLQEGYDQGRAAATEAIALWKKGPTTPASTPA
jgi:predicted patatin/cPLA2 family phospholipase